VTRLAIFRSLNPQFTMTKGLMSINTPRRKFLRTAGAGLLLPAAGGASTTDPKAAFQPPPHVVSRTPGKTGPKISGLGYGIGFVPMTEEGSRALDMGIHNFDMSRDAGDSEKILSGIVNGRDRVRAPYYMIYS
jgi:hypothetical protein